VTALLTEVPARAMAVYAHPDDPDVSCGATLAHWAAKGAEGRLVVVNAGDKGSPNHRDHREVGWAVVDAVAPAACHESRVGTIPPTWPTCSGPDWPRPARRPASATRRASAAFASPRAGGPPTARRSSAPC
jgi:LmbE family N-acetylglucosaminyl deacetylase